ncbi:alanine--tRNA ligase [Thermodesulfovibrio yellowstonii]|uniref:alanine--tRNA ligase n=1 Tax=Thermodesulfovibrio yellowstonii TaxID=28262 RepID=UPI0024B34E6A|nr:alanine--tRNA ligase [Thermodesulfovibrio yellowstonii]MDI6864368.1 alanine--tRNA ligase [Thermodesulfovibrio yellowstonii]
MQSSEIRKLFLDYFVSKGHELVKSSPLIPKDDPSLLFTNAGMVQFKRVFLGEEQRPYSRATTCQKCIRAGGKHSDLENVGFTARHHTFFEMLGNFSFGDYFKRDAILFAWELLTEHFKLPKEKLWVSIYKDDDEAAEIWEKEIGIHSERIVRLGEKDNFWQMGDTGPCGPCSEIIIDQGEDFGCGQPDCSVGCDCDRFLELWNLVFMQYNRDEEGKLTPLPKPSIDTGMGLERITAVKQGKRTNFDTDLFEPIISEICSTLNVKYGKDRKTDISIKVIADHIRAATFLVAEGLIPSNEGRGYVLRRIIRRAGRHIKLLGYDKTAFYRFVEPVVYKLGEVYPEIVSERERIEKIIKIEEERFLRSLEKAQQIFDDIINNLKKTDSKLIPGHEIFKLYDTFGLPFDLIKEMAQDSELQIDEIGFQQELNKQRERARAAQKSEEVGIGEVYKQLRLQAENLRFIGYTDYETETDIYAIVKNSERVNELNKNEEGEVFLFKTPFYAESGGQIGDTGMIISNSGKAEVYDTKKISGLHCHKVRVIEGTIKEGDKVFAKIDLERRKAIKRNHTATHLLHAALRTVLGEHVKQAGSLVATDRLRFDFTHFEAVNDEELREIERIVNEKILENLPVKIEIKSLDEALNEGVTALFEDKYEDTVRVVKIVGFSKELCGGTHCDNTGEIGSFYIVSEGSVASGIRRIEAVTGIEAFKYSNTNREQLKAISSILKSAEPVKAVERLVAELKEKQQEIEVLKNKLVSQNIEEIVKQAKEIDGVKALAVKLDGVDLKSLRTLSDKLKEKLHPAIILLISKADGQGILLLSVTKDITNKYDAGKLMRNIVQAVGGKGGGRQETAQGGCPDGESLEKVSEIFYSLIEKQS